MRRKMPNSNQWDENMTHNDLDKIQKVITEFDEAFQQLTYVFHSTDGDCNEIMWMKDKSMQWCKGSFDDVYRREFLNWIAYCMDNIIDYRKHVAEKKNEKLHFQVCIEEVARQIVEGEDDVRREDEYLLKDKWEGKENKFFEAYRNEIAEMEEEV